MDYQKLLPTLAIALGLSASAAQAMADDHATSVFGMSEVNPSGLLLAREKGCAGICAGRKILHKKHKDGDKKCASKGGDKNCASKGGDKNCSSKSGDKSCASTSAGNKGGDNTCAGKGSNSCSSKR